MKNLPEGSAVFDTADYLNTEADIAEYLKACAEYDDPKLMLNALNVIARVRRDDADVGCGLRCSMWDLCNDQRFENGSRPAPG